MSNPREASSDLLSRLNVNMPEKSDFIRLQLSDTDPFRAAATLNAIDSQFVILAADLKKRQIAELSVILKSQLDTVRQQMEEAENRLKNYRISVITEPTTEIALAPPGMGTQGQSPAYGGYIGKKMELEQVRLEKGSPLVECVNLALQEMKGDGTLDEIRQEWLSDKTDVPLIED